MGCRVWTPRLKQENPDVGPVTLVYTDGPMFVDPYGPPQRRAAMIRQESHPTNSAALTRVQKLWGHAGFCDPMIIEKSREPLWNVVELKRVIEGTDSGAPTLANLLRRIAEEIKATSATFAWTGKGPTPAERRLNQQKIEDLAIKIEELATTALDDETASKKFENFCTKLRDLGKRPRDTLFNSVADAFVAAEKMMLDDFRLSQGNDESCVVVLADDGRTRVITQIPREAIDDHLQARELSHRQRIAFAEKNLLQIARVIEKKYYSQDYTIYQDRFGKSDENNKLITITSKDLDRIISS